MGLQQLVVDRDGTIDADFLSGLPAAGVTVSLFAQDFDPDSPTFEELLTKVDAQVATVDPVDTTIDGSGSPIDAGTTSITVASGANIRPGRRYKIGVVGAGEPDENVRVKSVLGTVVELTAPTLFEHADGVQFKGLRASYTVPKAATNFYWTDGYSTWSETGTDDEPIVQEVVDCTSTKIPEALCDIGDVRQIMPQIDQMLDENLDVYQALREARDSVLMAFGADRSRFSFGSSLLRRACAFQFLVHRKHSFGERWAENALKWREDLGDELQEARIKLPADRDQDGIANKSDGSDAIGMAAV